MKTGKIALYATTGKRQEKHRLVLYIAVDKDWSARNLERNGNTGYALAMAPMTPEAWQYRNESTRARSLQYSGIGKATADGMREDLRSLGFDDETVERFAIAAAPYWSNVSDHRPPEPKANGGSMGRFVGLLLSLHGPHLWHSQNKLNRGLDLCIQYAKSDPIVSIRHTCTLQFV